MLLNMYVWECGDKQEKLLVANAFCIVKMVSSFSSIVDVEGDSHRYAE